ncbi:MAG: outer membrane lipoprotein chaperone LolA [Psychromonas sp.]
MKKVLLSVCLLLLSSVSHALSVEATQLKEKLALFDQIKASFVQRVLSPEGKLLNESRGEMIISRPGKFFWQVNVPEEELIVSDGQTIWYYSPFIEQVTLINFSDAINDTPFALIAGSDDEQWQDYMVSKQNNQFTVTNPDNVQATTFIFDFDNNDNISQFVMIEALGQRSEFMLTHQSIDTKVPNTLFNFNIPAGVEVDDQR